MTAINWFNNEVHDGKSVIFKAGVGSSNYNLLVKPEKQEDHPDLPAELLEVGSDYDFKLYVTPTVEDLINKYEHHVAFQEIGVGDGEAHDIRKLKKVLLSANINFLETLFSKTFSANNMYYDEVVELVSLRNDIARMNLRAFYNGLFGSLRNELKHIEKGNSKTQYLVQRYGYDTKNAMGALRLLMTFFKFRFSGHQNFERAIHFENPQREFLMDVRHGRTSLSETMLHIETLRHEFLLCEKEYQNYRIDEETDAKVTKIIRSICEKSLRYELAPLT